MENRLRERFGFFARPIVIKLTKLKGRLHCKYNYYVHPAVILTRLGGEESLKTRTRDPSFHSG